MLNIQTMLNIYFSRKIFDCKFAVKEKSRIFVV
nr:MAG TPA_asm: hypothetical protein [Caudoviricetes sp.]